MCIDYARGRRQRLGITASSRYGSAPERSRFKRLIREAFRLSRDLLPAGLEIVVIPRKLAKNATLADIRTELLRLFK